MKNKLSFNANIAAADYKISSLYRRLVLYPMWMGYQKRRMLESYLPAFFRFKSIRKSWPRMIGEISLLLFVYRCLPYHYFRYALYRTKFTLNDVLSFYPETLFYYKILPSLNKNYIILDDKNIFDSLARGAGIPLPRTLIKIKNNGIFTWDGLPIENDIEFQQCLENTQAKSLFCKPASFSSGGKGIFTVAKENHTWITTSGAVLNYSFISRLKSEDWIIQEAVNNCNDVAGVFDGCTNSFRILTVIKGSVVSVAYCSLKFGRGDCATDNAHTGGLYVGVNHETGELDSTAYDENLNEYTKHPTTGIEFRGIKIKGIIDIIDCAKKCAAACPDVKVAGWDIVLSSVGPIVLEGNSSSGLTIFQRPFKGLQALLHILGKFEYIPQSETLPKLHTLIKKLRCVVARFGAH